MSQHYANTMVIRCKDDRYSPSYDLEKAFNQILEKENAKVNYLSTYFGACLNISNPKYHDAYVDDIAIAKELHVNKIILVEHMDCGAYFLKFPGLKIEEEREKHLETIQKAKEFFAKEAPDFNFTAYLQDGESFEEI